MEAFSPFLGLAFVAAGPEAVLVMGELSWVSRRQLWGKKNLVSLFPAEGGRGTRSGEWFLRHRCQERWLRSPQPPSRGIFLATLGTGTSLGRAMSPCLLGPRQTARPEEVVTADTREEGRPAPHRRASFQRAHEVGGIQENLQKQQDPSEGGWFPPRGQGHVGSQSTWELETPHQPTVPGCSLENKLVLPCSGFKQLFMTTSHSSGCWPVLNVELLL